ncbi:hypothetical protein BDV96DRAFT_600511 [Lophiotrema nucula]|uniref:Uncharacterized protein n=1 Tax=Lophiotrema nucula TaxID=690887 RepID=A0A6A5Z5B6_9PLEO|nr:hypothetical protein BDV96DRAFT_600511 [Lophiotrema nucula]
MLMAIAGVGAIGALVTELVEVGTTTASTITTTKLHNRDDHLARLQEASSEHWNDNYAESTINTEISHEWLQYSTFSAYLTSFAAGSARAFSRSSHVITFAVLSIVDLVDRSS